MKIWQKSQPSHQQFIRQSWLLPLCYDNYNIRSNDNEKTYYLSQYGCVITDKYRKADSMPVSTRSCQSAHSDARFDKK